MKNKFLIFFIVLLVLTSSLFFILFYNQPKDNYGHTGKIKEEINNLFSKHTFNYSGGTCSSSSDCGYLGDMCGGGHGICTSNPNDVTYIYTCDIVPQHPINNNYSCSCIGDKCGWVETRH